MGKICDNGDCPYEKFVEYLKSRRIDGNVDLICKGKEPLVKGSEPTWFILLIVGMCVAGVVGVAIYV